MGHDWSRLNQATMDTWSDEFTLTPSTGGSPVVFSGVLDTSEIARAGEDGSHGRIFALVADFDTLPEKKDEISDGTKTYVVVSDPRRNEDDAGGLYIYIRIKA